MITGISSACFYPMETEKAVKFCGELGFKNLEIFVNAEQEMQGSIFNDIKATVNHYGINVCSVHPFTSTMESFTIFGSYSRRTDDTVEYYKKFFNFAAELNAGIFVLHGGNLHHTADNEEYFERYAKLYETGKQFGVTVSHENVVDRRAQSPEFVKRMNDYLNGNFALTLDLKQCRRAGESPFDFIKLVGEKIVNVHISDYNEISDCLPPFEGKEDFKKIIAALNEKNYSGEYLIELYSHNFKTAEQIKKAALKLDNLFAKLMNKKITE